LSALPPQRLASLSRASTMALQRWCPFQNGNWWLAIESKYFAGIAMPQHALPQASSFGFGNNADGRGGDWIWLRLLPFPLSSQQHLALLASRTSPPWKAEPSLRYPLPSMFLPMYTQIGEQFLVYQILFHNWFGFVLSNFCMPWHLAAHAYMPPCGNFLYEPLAPSIWLVLIC